MYSYPQVTFQGVRGIIADSDVYPKFLIAPNYPNYLEYVNDIKYITRMYLFYIDETGTPDINDKSPLFVLSAIAVQENQCRDLMDEFFSIKDKYFPHLKDKRFHEIKANDILRPSRAKNRRNIRFVNDIAHMFVRRNLHIFSFIV